MIDSDDEFITALSDRDAETMLTTLLTESGHDAEADGLTINDLATLDDLPAAEDDTGVPRRGDLCRLALNALRRNPSDVSGRLSTKKTASELLVRVVPKERPRTFAIGEPAMAMIAVSTLLALRACTIKRDVHGRWSFVFLGSDMYKQPDLVELLRALRALVKNR
jgi:hypothetical protein